MPSTHFTQLPLLVGVNSYDFFGAKSMVEIMDLIEDEFNFKRIERF